MKYTWKRKMLCPSLTKGLVVRKALAAAIFGGEDFPREASLCDQTETTGAGERCDRFDVTDCVFYSTVFVGRSYREIECSRAGSSYRTTLMLLNNIIWSLPHTNLSEGGCRRACAFLSLFLCISFFRFLFGKA